ncbi:phosphatase PAP2 family protein [Corynebacterium ciconiae]|uniref:phosphatase PAP2 family protein n=1 Tax=Corynebacterium ciconiae TaxID=227319 RepID=UPI000364760A|nr:phosphatase PAP2 family protein [Corynebacterium ciconiae]
MIATPLAHADVAEPSPQPFGSSDYVGYISDISSYPGGIYLQPIASFWDLKRNHPEVLDENLTRTIAINNAAADDPELIAAAQEGALADKKGLLPVVTDALGPTLAGHVRDALAEGRLPKTEMLLGRGWLARAGGLASSTFAEKAAFGYERPFVVAPDQINRYNPEGAQLYKNTKSFPSGHTNQATWHTTLLAYMLPEFAPQLIGRGAESGYHRVVLGVHYPLDVIGGRITGTAAAADRLNDPRMRAALDDAAAELRGELEWRCQSTLADCATDITPTDTVLETYAQRLDYGFDPVYNTDAPMIVPQAAPVLLASVFPELTWEQRAEVLRRTAAPAGAPLDDQSAAGSWQRINLARAAAAHVHVNDDGSLQVEG